jgi:ABC-2 type transport system permease protein
MSAALIPSLIPFVALIRKDLILFLSDRRALVISLALPIVIAAFFGSLFGSGAKTSAIEVALVQQDGSEIGNRIAAGLKADPNLRITALSMAEAEKAVRKGEQKVAIVLPAGFGEAAGAALFGSGEKPAIPLLYDPSQPAVLGMVKGMLTQQVMSTVTAEMFGGKMGQEMTARSLRRLDEQAKTDPDSRALRDMLASVQKYQALPQQSDAQGGQGAKGLSMPFTTQDRQLASGVAEQGYNAYAHAFAGMGVQFILFMGIDMGIGILLAQRSGVWNRLLAAPVNLTQVLLARAASGAIIAFALLCVVFAVAVFGFGVHIASLPGFLGLALCFGVLTASLGLLIAAFGKTPEAARRIAMFVVLIMVMLGGAWMPSFLFPAWMQKLTMAVPVRWAIDGLDAVTWRGLDAMAAAPAMGVQLGFALLFGVIAMWKFKREQR